jgi:hypothetical protein
MTFTYTPFSTDRDRVRFHIGDTSAAAPIFSDEEIAGIITEVGGWQQAVIECLENIIAKLAGTPNFTADWLTVSTSAALKAYKDLLASKRRKFGISEGRTATVTYQYRADSDADSTPDYANERTEYPGWDD